MSGRSRILAGLLGGSALWFTTLAGPTAARAAMLQEPADSARSAGQEFGELLKRWRAGGEVPLARLQALATQLAERHGRPDAARILESLSALTAAERQQGFGIEERVQELRQELGAAFADGVRDEDWRAMQAEVEQAISQAFEDSRGLADRGARAQASSLRAEYVIARLEGRTSSLSAEERDALSARALADAREAIADCDAFGIVRLRLNPMESLARLEHFLGHMGAARAAFHELATQARSIGDQPAELRARAWLLRLAGERGDTLDAQRCLLQMSEVSPAKGNWVLTREAAMRSLHEDRPLDARRILAGFEAPAGNDREQAADRRELAYVNALVQLRLQEPAEARRFAALAAAEGPPVSKGTERFEQSYLEARIDLAEGRPRQALQRFDGSMDLAKLSPRDQGAARTLRGEALLELGDAAGAKLELERALAMADAQRRRALAEPMSKLDGAVHFNVIGEWEGAGLETVALLARAHLALGDAAAAALACESWQSRSLRGEDSELERLRARAGEPPLLTPLTAKHLAAWAGRYELGLVTWIFGADSGVVVHVRAGPDGVLDGHGEVLRFGREYVHETGLSLRQLAAEGIDVTGRAEALAALLLPQGLCDHIGAPKSRSDRLLLLLHGPLEAIPVELLGLRTAGFDEQLRLLTLPGLPASEPGPAADARALARWALLGSPVDGASSEGAPRLLLPGASAELRELAQMRQGSDLIVPGQFSRADLERALRGEHCVHVATHLVSGRAGERSRFPAVGLRLDDGDVMTALEIAQLSPRLPLVVLAACESGGGRYEDGEGLFGVSRAFLERGTRNLVVTLWPVGDRAAREFSLAFHRGLLAGAPPSEAARQARLELRRKDPGAGDWAAFRFVGRD